MSEPRFEEAVEAICDELDPQDSVEFFAIVGLADGILGDSTPEQMLRTYRDETGYGVPSDEADELAKGLEGVITSADMALTEQEIGLIGDAIGYLRDLPEVSA